MRLFLGILTLFILASPKIIAQEFFVKTDSKAIERRRLDFEMNADRAIRLSNPEIWDAFKIEGSKATTGNWIPAREATDTEKLIDAGFAIFTALMVLATHDTYEIRDDLKLSSLRGALFFFFPFEDHFLYMSCKNEQHLVATTVKPSEDTLKRMKTLKEVQDLCRDEEKDKTSQDPA